MHAKANALKPRPCKSRRRRWIPEKYFHAFQSVVATYEREHPHWRIEVLISLIKWGIRSLRHSIEEGPNSKITWTNPLVELHYSVEWDWKAAHDGAVVYGSQRMGMVTPQNTSNVKAAAKTVGSMVARRLTVAALEDFTHGAWFEKRENIYVPYLAPELDTTVRQIRGKWKKREAVEGAFKPFWIGTTRIDWPGGTREKRGRMPRAVAKRLDAVQQRMDIPGISFAGDVNGRSIWSGLVFEIQPLVIDYDTREAYYAVTAGLAFEHKLVGNEVISLTPASWPRKDQAAFWEQVLQRIHELNEKLIPEEESRNSIILVQNDEILKVQPLRCSKDMKVAKQLLSGFHTQRQEEERRAREGTRLLRLLRRCDLAKTADEKGRALEELMAGLFNTVPGLRVVKSRARTQTEEIDLVICRDSHAAGFMDEAEFILVECKKWSGKCGKDEFVLFEKKIHNRRDRSSLGFLISWNGFTDTFTKEMLRGSHERLLIVPLDGEQIRNATQRGTFASLLQEARRDAVLV
jgi:Restriction endonuclease